MAVLCIDRYQLASQERLWPDVVHAQHLAIAHRALHTGSHNATERARGASLGLRHPSWQGYPR